MKKQSVTKKVVIAYVPVLHEGYMRFFNKHSDAEMLYLVGPEIIKDHKSLTKDLRALETRMMKQVTESLDLFEEVRVIGYSDLGELASSGISIIMPDEMIMRSLKEEYLTNVKVHFDSIFLRWDKHKSFENKAVNADQTISKSAFDKQMMKVLKLEAAKSADFWRHIGAAVVKDGKIVLKTHNIAVPSEQIHYVEGDPRSDFSKGLNVELSLFFHCEAQLIAEAARKGISLDGASMYVTTFPCPPCAKLIAYSGIKRLYYADGYGVLDGERVLKSR